MSAAPMSGRHPGDFAVYSGLKFLSVFLISSSPDTRGTAPPTPTAAASLFVLVFLLFCFSRLTKFPYVLTLKQNPPGLPQTWPILPSPFHLEPRAGSSSPIAGLATSRGPYQALQCTHATKSQPCQVEKAGTDFYGLTEDLLTARLKNPSLECSPQSKASCIAPKL